MGLASLFRRKTNYFKTSIEPQCAYCQFGRRTKDGGRILCEKKGLMEENASCKKFVYSPLKRIPVKQLNIEGAVTDEEMYVEISEEELAAKQVAAAKADAAEKAHAEKVKADQMAKEQADAKAAQEAKAKAEAEAKAKAKAEAEAKAKAEAEAKAKAQAAVQPAAPSPVDEIAQAAAAAEAAAQNLTAKPAAPAPQAQNAAPHAPQAPAQQAAPQQAPNAAAPAANTSEEEAAKAAAAASISQFKEASKAAAELDDEFADLDSVDEADVVVAQEHEVMKSKKQRLVAESEKPKGPLPTLPSASSFIRNKKGTGSGDKKSSAKSAVPPKPPIQAMHQVPPKSQSTDQK